MEGKSKLNKQKIYNP